MGDMSELKPLVVIGVFTASFIFMTLQIPLNFQDMSAYDNFRNIEYLDYWDAGTIRNYADVNETRIDPNVTLARWDQLPDFLWANLFSQELDDGDGESPVDFGGYEEIWLLSRYSLNSSEGRIYVGYPLQRFLGMGWVTRWAWGEWYFVNGTSIAHNPHCYGDNRVMTKFILEEYWEEVDSYGVQLNYSSFKVKINYEERQQLWFDVHFSFNSSMYGDPQFAWDSNGGDLVPDDLFVLTGINFDQTRTSYDAWNILEALLFFQVPDLLSGTPVFVGYLLSIIIWIPIIYVTFIIILRAIGSVFGGGGA